MLPMLLMMMFWVSLAILVYAQLLYGMFLILIGRIFAHHRTANDPSNLPFVSVLIPAYNEETIIRTKLRNTLSIEYPSDRMEIIVVSDGSTDQTAEIARSVVESRIQVLECETRRGKAEAINEAVRKSRGAVLCLCDANVMFRPDALAHLVGRLQDSQVGAVSGDVRLTSEESLFGRGESAYYQLERGVQLGESRIGSMMGVDGGMFVVRRELYDDLPGDTILDDFVISMGVIRRGKRVVYEPSAVATENATQRATDEFRRRVRLTAGAVQALSRRNWPSPIRTPVEFWQFVSHKLLRWLGPVWLVLILSSGVVLWNDGRVYQTVVVGQVVLYAVALTAAFCLYLRETWIGGAAFYFVMSHVAMGVGLIKGLLNRQRVTWNRTARIAPASETLRGN